MKHGTNPNAPIPVVHLIQGLEVGGLEMMVVNFLERLDRARYRPAVCCFDTLGSLAGRLSGQGIDVHLVQRRPGVDLAYVPRLVRQLRALRPQILHLHNPTAFFYGTLAGRLARVPCIIYTEHGRDFSSSIKVKLANRVLARLVDHVVTVAEYGKRYLSAEEGVPPAKIRTIHNGIDGTRFAVRTDRQAVRDALGLGPEQPVLGIVARLDPIKHHVLLIDAMRRVTEQRPDAVLLVVGDGPMRTGLEQLTRKLGLDGAVRFLGERADVPALLGALDLFVLCSRSEGLSLTLVEASAAGLPIVATDVGGNGEVVVHGQTGLLVPSGDSAALSGALLEVLADAGRRAQLGRAARARFEAQFTLEGMVQAYEGLYAECASGRA